jgi:transcription initiation factor IIE alpha subunit
MAQPALMALATGELFGEQARVFFGLIAMLDFENWIQLNQAELSEKLKMKRQNFNRALLKLENEKILIRGPRVGRCTTFRLNPNYGWKGSAKKHNQALQTKMDKLGISVVENKDA